MLPNISGDRRAKVTKLCSNLIQQEDTVQGSAELFCSISLQTRLICLNLTQANTYLKNKN